MPSRPYLRNRRLSLVRGSPEFLCRYGAEARREEIPAARCKASLT
jgi:hypothetical protein